MMRTRWLILIAVTAVTAVVATTAALLFALDVFNNPTDVAERSLVALNAWSAYALAVLAVIGGLVAWWSYREAVVARYDALRPVIVVSDPITGLDVGRNVPTRGAREGAAFVDSDRLFVQLTVRNVGVGPARGVQLKAWLVPPSARSGGIITYTKASPPDVSLSYDALAASESRCERVVLDVELVDFKDTVGELAFVATYRDTYDRDVGSSEPSVVATRLWDASTDRWP